MVGGSELEEIELPHLDGHKGSRPVRIGNGAATHIQLVRISDSVSSLTLTGLRFSTLPVGYLW